MQDLFAAAGACLDPSGHFIFTIEANTAVDTYELRSTHRFVHNPGWISAILEETGFAVVEIKDAQLRTESNQPVAGAVFVAETLRA